jgi:hypothetical protein
MFTSTDVESMKTEVEDYFRSKSGGMKLSELERQFGPDVSFILKHLIDGGIVRNVYTSQMGWIYYYKGNG